MSCGDTSWGWFRHYCDLCKVCGSIVDAETKTCEHCENKKLDQEIEDSFYS